MMNPETPLKAAILDVLHAYGIEAWSCPSGHARRGRIRMAPKGTPDVIGYLSGGRMIALEVKRPGEELKPHQAAWLAKARAAGVCAHVVRSTGETSALLQEVLR